MKLFNKRKYNILQGQEMLKDLQLTSEVIQTIISDDSTIVLVTDTKNDLIRMNGAYSCKFIPAGSITPVAAMDLIVFHRWFYNSIRSSDIALNFVLLHEKGHLSLGHIADIPSRLFINEIEADKYAFDIIRVSKKTAILILEVVRNHLLNELTSRRAKFFIRLLFWIRIKSVQKQQLSNDYYGTTAEEI